MGRVGTSGREQKGLRFGDWCVFVLISSSLKSSDVAVVCVESRSDFSPYSAPKMLCCSWLCSSDGVMWAPLRRNSANLRVTRDENRSAVNSSTNQNPGSDSSTVVFTDSVPLWGTESQHRVPCGKARVAAVPPQFLQRGSGVSLRLLPILLLRQQPAVR